MPPAVSIIVPCYRAQATLPETIEGVLAQTAPDWECILVSDDGTSYLDFLTGLGIRDDRIVEIPQRTLATGTVAPRNRGFSMVRGGFVADLDCDDVWKPDRLEKLLPLADRHGCALDVLECFDRSGILGYSGPCDGAVRELGVADVVGFDFPFHPVVRRDRAGNIWSPHESRVPDVIRTMLLAAQAPVAWLGEPLLRYRVSGTSMSQSLDGSRRIDGAYGDIVDCLATGDGFGLDPEDRTAALAGIRRKRDLNRRYVKEAEKLSDPPPFIAWVLAEGHAGRPA